MQITQDRVVRFDYTLTDEAGKKIDSSIGKKPMAYMHGRRAIIPGLEAALEGKAAGESFQVTVAPEEAYGPYRPELSQIIDRKTIGKGQPVFVGGIVSRTEKTGRKLQYRVSKITDEGIVLDQNHPLAGKTLTFDVSIVEVRAAEIEELADGRPVELKAVEASAPVA